MYASWRVAVVLSAVNLAGPAMRSLILDSEAAGTSQTRLKHAMEGVKTAAVAGFAAAGVALTTFVATGVTEAAKFEQAMVTVGIATGATGKTLANMQNQIMDISSQTAQSATSIANEFAMVGRSGFSADQVKTLMPLFARYADVQMLSHGTDPVDAIRTAAQIAHQEGAYTPGTVAPMLELLNKISFMQPEEMSRIAMQGKYYIPILRSMGVSQAETIRETALLGITGYLRGRGGTSIANAIAGALNSVEMTSHRQNQKTGALWRLGLINHSGDPLFYDPHARQLLMPQLFQHLLNEKNAYEAHTPMGDAAFYNDVLKVFGKSAVNFIMTALRPETVHQMYQVDKKMSQIPSIEKAFNSYINTLAGLTNMLKTNVTNLFIATFLPALKYIEPYVKALAQDLGDAGAFLRNHPGAALKIAMGTMIAAAGSFAVVGGVAAIKMWQLVGAVVALGKAASLSSKETAAADAVQVLGGARFGRLGGLMKWLTGAALVEHLAAGGRSVTRWAHPMNIFHRPELFGWRHSAGELVETSYGRGMSTFDRFLMFARMRLSSIGDVVATPFRAAARYGGALVRPGTIIGDMLADIGRVVLRMAPGFRLVTGILMRFIPWIARLGFKFIPIIGWVMLAIDAFNLFRKHGTDIAWVLGEIVGWMRYHLWPGIVTEAGKGWQAVATAFVNAIRALWNSITSFVVNFVHNPIGTIQGMGGSVSNWWSNVVGAFQGGMASQDPNLRTNPAIYRVPGDHDPGANVNLTFNISHPDANVITNRVAKHIARKAPGALRNTYQGAAGLSALMYGTQGATP